MWRMLQIHNAKTKKVLGRCREEQDLRRQAKELNVSVAELKRRAKEETGRKGRKSSKRAQVEVTIKVKKSDGSVVSFEEEEEVQSEKVFEYNIEEAKHKIQSEETLEMLKNVLKPKKAAKKKKKQLRKQVSEQECMDEYKEGILEVLPKKGGKKKKTV